MFAISNKASVFLTDGNGRHKCKICRDHKYQPLSKARRHEDSAKHVQAVRYMDRMGLPSPVKPPRRHHGDQSDEHDTDDDLSESSNDSGVLAFSYFRRNGLIRGYIEIYDIPITIHGCHLEGDDESQIYSNYDGLLEMNEQEAYVDGDPDAEGSQNDTDPDSDNPFSGNQYSDIPFMSESASSPPLDPLEDDMPHMSARFKPWNNREVSLMGMRNKSIN